MDSFQGIALSLKLDYLEGWNRQRQQIASLYREELEDLSEVRFQRVPSGFIHAYHVFAILAERRDGLQAFLTGLGIETRVIYPIPVHLHPAYQHLGLVKGDFPNTESICDSVLCLPMYPGLDHDCVRDVAEHIRQFYRKA